MNNGEKTFECHWKSIENYIRTNKNINKIQTLLQTTNIIGLCILKFEIRKFLKLAYNNIILKL